MAIALIGIDAAVKPKDTGIALASYESGVTRLTAVGLLSLVALTGLAAWTNSADQVLIAIDAPLGWPEPLSSGLVLHAAGDALAEPADQMFLRETDRAVKRNIGKSGLSVGADKIARTAHQALCLIEDLRNMTGQRIELAWEREPWNQAKMIEVYPAATLKARHWTDTGYKDIGNRAKKDAAREIRSSLATKLARCVDLNRFHDRLVEDDDQLDAALCVLAAADFMDGNSIQPVDLPLAEKEGWIWVTNPFDDAHV
ncbi:MAG: DUF429 domain-containing protein [Chloroflexi bacterium]|nr:DUF429 domain-containing protein [Chloroflexota bacterium]